MYKIILLYVALFSLIVGQDREAFIHDLTTLEEASFFDQASMAISVLDAKTGEVLYQKDEKKLLHPASNMKVLTSASLVYFDENYEFKTFLLADGEIKDSVLHGNLIFKGGLDPDFNITDLSALVKSLSDKGIKKINGDLLADISLTDSLRWGNGWMWDDDPYQDFPFMTALNIEKAGVKLFNSPAKAPGDLMEYRIYPESDFYKVNNFVKTIAEDTTDIKITRTFNNGINIYTLEGFISVYETEDSTDLNIGRPELYFLHLAKDKLQENGIEFAGTYDTLSFYPKAIVIDSLKRNFKEVITKLNKDSDNLNAEMALRALATLYRNEPASAENGVKMIDSLITEIGLDPEDYKIVDGSGVSHYNLVTTQLLSEMLLYMYHIQPKYEMLKNSFPVAGLDGTLKHRMKGTAAYKKVHAKTGTLSGVSALSGYADTDKGNTVIFSIMMQNYVVKSRVPRYFQDKICEMIIKHL